MDIATATDGSGTGWNLSDFRHSGLAHLARAGATLDELMAKSRATRPENLLAYFDGLPPLLDPTG
ncbi:hypothetical protein [Nocardia terpenica]|uniref:Uncharacterized protein n=1 Tax=Nocardia terpenica TaxID=455432 RepID=A0A164IZJ0_9NOCA|nr:hypothetical protein [Nocardia terpenica]KZM69890.1 hypothetical protein AWN90_04590 [Nocardia terpenica]